ncbi:peptidoglycan-binding protein, partial [Bacillus sp. JJ864]|uniref:peptidoglycan-binding domain-containing protein n=1 Tax=Bacillus sp. JJ864 TaxID=3122975 RepID=UPI003F68A98A
MKSVNEPDMDRINEPLYRQPSGKFFAKIYEKGTERPIKDAKISIYEMTEDGKIVTPRQDNIITLHTDEFGETPTIALPAPPQEYAFDPLGPKPYSEYTISIEVEGYEPVIIRGAQIFAEVTAKQTMELEAINETTGRSSVKTFDIPAHKLIGQYPQQEIQPQISRNHDTDVMIPEFVIVHLGHPDARAPRVKVKFKDYIKNVVAHEIMPLWKREAIIANALCIMSFTLNRVYTKHYAVKGFTITNKIQFDQQYVLGGNTYEQTDDVVEEIFKQYIAKPGIIEPFFAQYRAGRKIPCPYAIRPGILYQWGTSCLAEQGKNHIEILKYYYKDIEIRLAEFIQVVKSFPGTNLKEGDQNEAVRTIQKYLYHIRKKYKDIPEINVSGIFDSNTTNAVKSFQKYFQLVENGIVDNVTWNQISDIYVNVINLPGAYPILQAGSRGESVKILQILLKRAGLYTDEPDGIFGTGTEKSVKEFQKIKGFTITGVVRKELWTILEESQTFVRNYQNASSN